MASTPVHPDVLKAIHSYHHNNFGNPYSAHSHGVAANKTFLKAMEECARTFSCPQNSLYLTSGATESNAIAIQGVVNTALHSGLSRPHVLTSAIEHPSVSGVKKMADQGLIDHDEIPIDGDGIVDLQSLQSLIKPETVLISVMLVNSEIGTIQPINNIAKLIRRYRKQHGLINSDHHYPLLHSDASQAVLTNKINLQKLHVDLLTINGHKVYAPTGSGLLYVNPVIKDLIAPLFVANYEKTYLRPGTASVANAIALSQVLKIVTDKRSKFVLKSGNLFKFFTDELQKLGGVINGSVDIDNKRVPTNISVSFPDVNHEFLQMQLDAAGISCATRSACLERGGEGSDVLDALHQGAGIPITSNQALRFSFGYETTQSELEIVVLEIKQCLQIQRSV